MKSSLIRGLKEATAYQNDLVVDRFIGMYEIPGDEAEIIFRETKKWLWLCATANHERRNGCSVPRLVIDNHLLFIDEMWHNFILFTKEYHEYCRNNFGFYVHHKPTPERIKEQLRGEMELDSGFEEIMKLRKEQYSYIYDKLGSETLDLWYGQLCDKYTKQYFAQIRK